MEELRNTRFAVGGGTDEEGDGLETPEDISEEEAQIFSRHYCWENPPSTDYMSTTVSLSLY
mgnify:CR=1